MQSIIGNDCKKQLKRKSHQTVQLTGATTTTTTPPNRNYDICIFLMDLSCLITTTQTLLINSVTIGDILYSSHIHTHTQTHTHTLLAFYSNEPFNGIICLQIDSIRVKGITVAKYGKCQKSKDDCLDCQIDFNQNNPLLSKDLTQNPNLFDIHLL